MKTFFIWTVSLISLLSCRLSQPQVDSVEYVDRITVSLAADEISSDRQCVVEIDIIYSSLYIPEIPSLSNLFDPVKIDEYEDSGRIIEEGGFIRRRIRLTLENLLPGDYLLKPITIPLLKDGMEEKKLRSEYLPLKVTSRLTGEGEFIDDIPLRKETKNRFLPALIIIGVLLLTAAAFLFNNIRKGFSVQAIDKKDYFEMISSLDKETGDPQFYGNLTAILREFLDNTVFLSTQSQTTEEFIQSASESAVLDEPMKDRLFLFFSRSDKYCFGNIPAGEEQRAIDLRFCADFIDYIQNKISVEAGQ